MSPAPRAAERVEGAEGPGRQALAYLAALAGSVLALAIASAVGPYLDTYTVLPSVAAVLLAAWVGGLGPGLLATAVSVAGIDFLFVSPVFGFRPALLSDAIRLGFFTLISLLTSYISERYRRSSRALRESEERMRLFLDAVREYAIFFLDADGRIVRWTEGARRIGGFEAEEVLGRHISLLYPPQGAEDGTAEEHLRIAAEAGEFLGEGHRVRRGGGVFWARVTVTALRRNGRLVGYAQVIRDLTEPRRVETALREANREIAATTYAIAHDLRSPLRAIDAYGFFLHQGYGERLGGEGREHLQRIRAAAQRMGALIDGLLSLARIGRTELTREVVDLGALARVTRDECGAAEAGRRLELRLDGDLRVVGDPRLLAVVMQNLVGNACKFTRGRETAIVEVTGTRDGEEQIVRVRDNGVGFHPEHAGNLFRPFHRLHGEAEFPGHGIGLATVRRIIERHGGRVWAEGSPGEGATFSLSLPAPPAR